MTVVVCEAAKTLPLARQSGDCPSLRIIITMADSVTEEENAAALKAGVRVYTMAEVKVCVSFTCCVCVCVCSDAYAYSLL